MLCITVRLYTIAVRFGERLVSCLKFHKGVFYAVGNNPSMVVLK